MTDLFIRENEPRVTRVKAIFISLNLDTGPGVSLSNTF